MQNQQTIAIFIFNDDRIVVTNMEFYNLKTVILFNELPLICSIVVDIPEVE